MKSLVRYVVLSLGLLSCGTQKIDPKILILGTDPTYYPYERVGENGECEGFDIDVAHAIADKLGKRLIIKQFGFTALILALKQSKVDLLLAGMSITPSRAKEITMIPYQGKPITSFSLVFWNKKPMDVKGLEDVHHVAVMVGTCEEDLLRTLPHITYKSLENTTEILLDLQYGKSEAALIEPKVAAVLQKQFPELELLEIKLDPKDWTLGKGIGLKKDSPLTDEIQKAVAELKADGTLEKLEKKWLQ